MDTSATDRVTVAFQLAALERLADPTSVFEQTADWASHVGVVSDRQTHAITGYAREHHLDIGFHSGPRTVLEALPYIRGQPELAADRYLLIGTGDIDAEAVRDAGWAWLALDDAAAAAGWGLQGAGDQPGEESSWL